MRPALATDHAVIREVLAAAFTDEDVAKVVDGVRAEDRAMVELVEEHEGAVVAYVLFSRMTVTSPRLVAGLGPLAVRPDLQSQGIGEALSRAGLEAVRALGAEACVVLGHPTYYPRFGFSREAAAHIASPFADRPAFMAMAFAPDALAEPLKVDYPAAFG